MKKISLLDLHALQRSDYGGQTVGSKLHQSKRETLAKNIHVLVQVEKMLNVARWVQVVASLVDTSAKKGSTLKPGKLYSLSSGPWEITTIEMSQDNL